MDTHKHQRSRTGFYKKIHWFKILKNIFMLITGLFFTLSGMAYASDQQNSGESHTQVKLPNTEYTESNIDLRVKVLGGEVKLNRTWVNGRWYLNPAWANLRFILDPLDNTVKAIDRTGTIYERSGNKDLYIYKQVIIKKTDSGWKWSDQHGNWIDYDNQGRVLAYGDASNVKVSFILDKDGRRIAINDHHGKTVYQFDYDNQEHLIKATDRSGRSVRYEWSGEKLIKVIDVSGHVWQYGYDANGQLNKKIQPDNSVINIDYTLSVPAPKTAMTSGKEGGVISQNAVISTGAAPVENKLARVGKITDQTGAATIYSSQYDRVKRQYTITVYDALGKKIVSRFNTQGKIIDQNINDKLTTSYKYDDAKHIVIVTNPRGLNTTIQYNQAQQPTKVIYPNGNTELYEYNHINQPVKYTNAKGEVFTFAYDSTHQLSKIVSVVGKPEQRIISFTYDNYGQPITTTIGEGKEAIQLHQSFDENGNVKTYTDSKGHQYHYTYNVQGQATSLQNPLKQSWRYQYDAAGYLTDFIDPLQHITHINTDAFGRITQITDPLGHKTQYHYLLGNNKRETKITNALNQTTTYYYDAVGNLTKAQSPSGLVTQQHYNADGDLKSSTDVAGNITSYEYGDKNTDQAGLLTQIRYPTFSKSYHYDAVDNVTAINLSFDKNILTTRINYDQTGLITAITDAADRNTRFVYNTLEQLTQHTDAQNHTTQYKYDPLDNVTEIINAKGQSYHFSYDKNSNLITESRSLSNSVNNRYNEVDQLIEQQQANKQRIQYQYDGRGNLIKERYFAPNETTAKQEVSYRYDAAANLVEVIQTGETNSHFIYQHDALGRTIQETITYGSGNQSITKELKYSYDADGNLASMTYPDNTTVTYHYEKGQLTKTSLANGETINWRNYQWHVPTQVIYPQAVQTNRYDALQRPVQNSVVVNKQTVFDRQYSYDQAGNISHIKSEKGEITYQYDSLDQLIQIQPSGELKKLGLEAEAYSYDAIGNRIGSIKEGGNWTYNELDQLIRWGQENEQTDLSYTTNGQLTSETKAGKIRHYHYNAAERLSAISENNIELAHYQYDPFGRRISKTVDDHTTYYLYTEEGLIAELDQSGTMQVAYGWKPDSYYSTSPLWHASLTHNQTLKNADYHFLITDHLGTPQLALDSSGQVVWKMYSDAFGNTILAQDNQITLNLRFAGQYYDAETGLSYNYFRNYDPKTGRYIQSDPIGLLGGINTFTYAKANPLTYIDPTGEFLPLGAAAAAAAGVAAKVASFAIKLAIKCWKNSNCRETASGIAAGLVFKSLEPCYDGGFSVESSRKKTSHGPIMKANKNKKADKDEISTRSSSPLPHPEPVKTEIKGQYLHSNEKHTKGMRGSKIDAGIEPRNSLDLFNRSIPYGEHRWALEGKNVHRFSRTDHNTWHWSGSMGNERSPMTLNEIPSGVRKKFKLKVKGK